MKCPQCGGVNSSQARFCDQCGTRLAPARAAERRQLTVMFCDLVDSTAMSSAFDPEVLRELLSAYQSAAGEAILLEEGHIAQYLGDGLLVYFGFPQAYEDAAARAVRAGLGILRALDRINDEGPQKGRPPLRARIGIHTGSVVVGEVGAGARREQLALGETPNVAARLQALAAPGQVVISDATLRLTRSGFEVLDLGPQALKGLAEPVRCWRILRESASLPPADRVPTLVGRGAELAMLHANWSQALQRQGRGVLVRGEPGIGKTRLCQAILERARADGARVLEMQCAHHRAGSALLPLVEALNRSLAQAIAARAVVDAATSTAQADDGDASLAAPTAAAGQPAHPVDPVDVLAEIAQGLGVDPSSVVPYIAPLLGLKGSSSVTAVEMSAAALRDRTLAALTTLALGAATQRPLLVVIEDLQWADPSTLEWLGRLLRRLDDAPMLLMCTARPEFTPAQDLPWQRLDLERCSQEVLTEIVREVAGEAAARLTQAQIARIVARADGVPLFAREMARALRDDADSAIPATLQDLLMARLDRLGPDKAVAQAAAVIGRRFSPALLQAATGLDALALDGALREAVRLALIENLGGVGADHYAFSHALFEDLAYQSMLRPARSAMHQRVAQAILDLDPNASRTQPEVLAHHCSEGALPAQAVEHWLRAARQALARSACAEAVSHARRGLDLVVQIPEAASQHAREADLRLVVAPSLMALQGAGAVEVEQAYQEAARACRQLGPTPKLVVPLWGLWAYVLMRGNYGQAMSLAEELGALAATTSAVGPGVIAAEAMGMTNFYRGEFAVALPVLERGLAMDRRSASSAADPRGVHDAGVMCRAFAGLAARLQGRDEAAEVHFDGLRSREAALNPFDRAFVRCLGAVMGHLRRDASVAAADAERALAIAREQGFPTWAALARVVRGWALARLGRPEEGVALARRGCDAWDGAGARNLLPYLLALLAEALLDAGQPAQALGVLDRAIDVIDVDGERWWEAEVHRLRAVAMLRLETATPAAVRESLRRARDLALAQGATMLRLRAEQGLADLGATPGGGAATDLPEEPHVAVNR